ncbi:DUF4417 domain-containing protein [Lactobacillus sp. UCMA15818]|uniref:DUF4417 domain-containing protein n=1 Tax=Lactobacillus sp. UCMA15818 TaxID=2583394 RepID=UPI0025AFDB5B|nr:DUF4417 domain-containing protein [Lactobacillus sp. UCMA15818]MDN2452512.1 DUF4417 domain-containing protein [Lactobacillus sp. UCMA15818]
MGSKRTVSKYNLDILSNVGFDTFEMPILKAERAIPTQLTGFNYALSKSEHNSFIHFYLDDYQFERVWNSPKKYVELFKKFDGIFTPDFSLYKDMPLPIQIYNVYRSRVLGRYYQDLGIKVIPTVSWSDEKSFDFCFEGLPTHSIVTVSTVGIMNNKFNKEMFIKGFNEMIERIDPREVLIYGKSIDVDFDRIEYFENKNIGRMTKQWVGEVQAVERVAVEEVQDLRHPVFLR